MAEQLPRLEDHLGVPHLVWQNAAGGIAYTRVAFVWINSESGRVAIGNPVAGPLRDPDPNEEAAARQLVDRVAAAG